MLEHDWYFPLFTNSKVQQRYFWIFSKIIFFLDRDFFSLCFPLSFFFHQRFLKTKTSSLFFSLFFFPPHCHFFKKKLGLQIFLNCHSVHNCITFRFLFLSPIQLSLQVVGRMRLRWSRRVPSLLPSPRCAFWWSPP